MHKSHEENVQYQFGPQAAAYVESSVHANGADLDWIEEGARMAQPICAIDLGAGVAMSPIASQSMLGGLSHLICRQTWSRRCWRQRKPRG